MSDTTALNAMAQDLAENLRALRSARKLTQGEIAVAAGITHNHYYLLESARSAVGGPANPRLSTLIALADAHHVGVADLLAPRTA